MHINQLYHFFGFDNIYFIVGIVDFDFSFCSLTLHTYTEAFNFYLDTHILYIVNG